jgi:hypothetical protein
VVHLLGAGARGVVAPALPVRRGAAHRSGRSGGGGGRAVVGGRPRRLQTLGPVVIEALDVGRAGLQLVGDLRDVAGRLVGVARPVGDRRAGLDDGGGVAQAVGLVVVVEGLLGEVAGGAVGELVGLVELGVRGPNRSC